MLANPNHPGSDPLVPFLDSRQRLRSLDSDWVFKSAHLLLDPYQCIKYIYRGFTDPFEPSFGGYGVFVYFICLCLWKMCFRSFLAPITLSEKPRRPLQAWVFSLRMRPEQAGTVLQARFHSILRTGMNVLRSDANPPPVCNAFSWIIV